MSTERTVVDAMLGICVHDPATYVEPPSVVRDWATRSLAGQLPGASLSREAKTRYMGALGARSFEESAQQAARDLPGKMREFMVSSDLDPEAYQMHTYTDELRPNLKILVMAAVRKEAARAAPTPPATEPPAAVPAASGEAPAKTAPPALPPSETIEAWADQIKRADKQKGAWRGFGCGASILGVIAVILVMGIVPEEGYEVPRGIGTLLGVVAVVVGIVLYVFASLLSKGVTKRLATRINKACEAESLSKPAIVEALWDQETTGAIGKAVLAEVEPETAALLTIRGRTFAFFGSDEEKISAIKINVSTSGNTVSSVTLDGEKAVDRWSAIALEYLDHKGYIEAIAALATLQSIYSQIAPPGGEILLQAKPDSDRLKQTSISAHKVISGFDLSPDMKAVYETLTKRRTQSLLQVLIAAQQGGQDSDRIADAAELDTSLFGYRDETVVAACIDHLGKRMDDFMQRIKAAMALSFLPDDRIVPYVLKAFGWMPFFPQGIDGLSRVGKSAVPPVLSAFKAGSGSLRFNAGLALGIMDAAGVATDLAELYPGLTAPLERIGCAYALVRAGQTARLADIIAGLDHREDNVRHTAAIALEHLPQGLDDELFLKYLDHQQMLVRLRMTRKLGAQGTKNPALWDALIARFEDPEESVRSAAVDALGGLDGADMYERVLPLARGGMVRSRICAYQVLGKLSNPEAVPLLLDGLRTAGDNDLRRAAITSLGELGAVEALDGLKSYFKNDDLAGAAMFAALRIGFTHKDAALKMLGRLGRDPKALFARTVLGDENGKKHYKSLLGTGTDIKVLLNALQYAPLLRDADFEEPLSKLIKYRKHTNFPGDRYIGYLALKALVSIKLAAAQAGAGGA